MTLWENLVSKLSSEIRAGLKMDVDGRGFEIKELHQTINVERGSLFKIEGGNVTINHYAAPPPKSKNNKESTPAREPFTIVKE
jgi:hypothetical protein